MSSKYGPNSKPKATSDAYRNSSFWDKKEENVTGEWPDVYNQKFTQFDGELTYDGDNSIPVELPEGATVNGKPAAKNQTLKHGDIIVMPDNQQA